ncbi:hypothetical protein ECZU36_57700 [Escherichia coli]|nr:hypothetical protein ECZU24_57750 [Escherichia coli]GHL84486.1 hypothetical protein ECZU36_57700 [Escherichia coli]
MMRLPEQEERQVAAGACELCGWRGPPAGRSRESVLSFRQPVGFVRSASPGYLQP